ncbi:hypothetical protein [Promicromonospora sukumoe]|uniref:Uncharacterized protein n=1 Tax=Promicromonospora sukumoe TaxID=88382 RepID=A0A7W3JBC4_9MICO|nr:hypothetical protein [Promicromonospora sukumoe]MBA8809735.1 hypothetical protein [Promicromonospora sukumoe]
MAVLLVLTVLFGGAAEQLPTSSAAVAVAPAEAPAEMPSALLGDGSVIAAETVGSHLHDTISLLCLCALVMVGVLLVTRRVHRASGDDAGSALLGCVPQIGHVSGSTSNAPSCRKPPHRQGAPS